MMGTMRKDLPTLPKQMADAPIDDRGYPVPWFVEWWNGQPEFRAMDRAKFMKAINEKRCWTCGRPLFSELVFVIGPMCAINRISSEPPSHRECATYAATACPFLTKPQAVRRKDNLPELKPSPGVMIERNPGVTLLWYTRYYRTLKVTNGLLFQIGRATRVDWYCRGRAATREEVLHSIETGLPTLREYAAKDGPEAEQVLEAQIVRAMKLVPKEA
jgi:hypothetical protein